MDIKTLFLLIFIFGVSCYRIEVFKFRFSTENYAKLFCWYNKHWKKATHIAMCHKPTYCGEMFKYNFTADAADFYNDTLRDFIDISMTNNYTEDKEGRRFYHFAFRRPKTLHSGGYKCYTYPNPVYFPEIIVLFFEHHLKILPYKDREHVQLWCKVYDLDVKPSKMEFDLPNEGKQLLENPIYTNITEKKIGTGETYYNITGKTSVSLGEIGDLPKTIRCKVTVTEPAKVDEIERRVNLTKMMISEDDTTSCPPNLRMEKHEIWEKGGKTNITLRCTFDIPQETEINKVEWFHNDSKEYRLMFNWTNEMGQYARPNYGTESFTSIAPVKLKGRHATTVTFKTAMIRHTGNYTCTVTFSKYKPQSFTALLAVYQLEPPIFTAIGCSDRKVRLECNTSDVYPKPQEVALSLYNPKSESKEKLENIIPKVFNKTNGLYDITMKNITRIDQLLFHASPNISCDIVLSKEFRIMETNWTSRKTYITDIRGSKVDLCSPKVEMQRPVQWLKLGQTSDLMRCSFEIPQNDEIESVEWLHNKLDERNIVYMWEKKKNMSMIISKYKDRILDSSSLIPGASGSRHATSFKLKDITFELGGNYSCRVNFSFAGTHSGTAMLLVYEIQKPFHFKASRCSDNQTVGLVCKADNIRPKPEEVAFYVYNPNNSRWSRIDTDLYINISDSNGLFAISAKMIAGIQWFPTTTSKLMAKCEIILHRDVTETTETNVADTSSNDECSPNFRADKHLLWEKVGKDVILRCTYHIPFKRRIKSVEWIHQNVSEALFTWEADANVMTKDQSDMSFVMTQDSEERQAMILNIEKAKIEHSGNYTCRMNYGLNSSQSDSTQLVVYQIEKPYYFEAIVRLYGNYKDVLKCKAGNLFPRPKEIVFYKQHLVTKLRTQLNKKPLSEIIEVNGLFNISANMTVELKEIEPVEYVCQVVLSKDPVILEETLKPVASDIISIADQQDTSDTTSKGGISSEIIIASGTVGAFILLVSLAYLLYACVYKRFSTASGDDTGRDHEESREGFVGRIFNLVTFTR